MLTAYDVGFGSAVWLEAGSDGEPRVVKRANLASGQVDTLMTYEEDGALHSPRAGDGFTLWILAARRNASFARGVDGEGEFDLSSLMPSGGAYQIESLAAGSGVAAFESGGDVSGVVVVDPRARSFASSVFGAAGFSAELLSDAHADDEDPYHPADFRAIDGSTVLYFHRRPDEADIPHVINYGGCAEGVEPVEQ